MHALGNDFIVIDNRGEGPEEVAARAEVLCHRRFGIGADQILLLQESSRADFRMLIYNADGSEVEMCGNGIRCLAKYIWSRGLSAADPLAIETLAGIIRPRRAAEGMIAVDMGEPVLDGLAIPTTVAGRIVDYPLVVGDRTFPVTCVSMGNPHAVIAVEGVEDFPVERYGPLIERHEMFPRRTNVEFIEPLGGDTIRMRVWERGTGVTMACGTGASAAAVAASIKGLAGRDSTVRLDGGDLRIEWGADNRVTMTGPAVEVYTGEIRL
jgi:diaminopimelate epimerase